MFEVLDGTSERECVICRANPATIKRTGKIQRERCLPCACKMLAQLTQRTIDNLARL